MFGLFGKKNKKKPEKSLEQQNQEEKIRTYDDEYGCDDYDEHGPIDDLNEDTDSSDDRE